MSENITSTPISHLRLIEIDGRHKFLECNYSCTQKLLKKNILTEEKNDGQLKLDSFMED